MEGGAGGAGPAGGTAGRRLFLGNLPYRATADAVRELLEEAGAVAAVHVPVDRVTGRARGYAMVEMATAEAAAQAIDRLSGRLFLGRNLVVAPARPPAGPGRPGAARPHPPGARGSRPGRRVRRP